MKCSVCKTGLFLNSDSTRCVTCVSLIDHCQTCQYSNDLGASVQCQTCEDGYDLSDDKLSCK